MDDEKYIKAKILSRFYKLALATNRKEIRQGLQGVKELPDRAGMVFIHNCSARHPYWMLNTYIPLTMLFLNENKKVVDVIHRQDTNNPVEKKPEHPAKYVIEVNYDPELSDCLGKEIEFLGVKSCER